MAALDVIVREAGGFFTSLDGEPGPTGGSALATNGKLHDQALAFLGSLPATDPHPGARCTTSAPARRTRRRRDSTTTPVQRAPAH